MAQVRESGQHAMEALNRFGQRAAGARQATLAGALAERLTRRRLLAAGATSGLAVAWRSRLFAAAPPRWRVVVLGAGSAGPRAPGGGALARRSAADVLDDLGIDSRARMLVSHDTIRDDYTVEPRQVSALFVAQGYKLTENLPDSGTEAFRVRRGNDRLPRRVASALGGAVHLRSPVTRVTTLSDRVRVEVGGDRVDADHCVVAAPLPPLRAVDFVPALPTALAEAIASLQYGIGTKTLVQYDSRGC